ncbi:MAG: hypothetical protein IJF80_05825 [Clostridia bacterium]|nr:hypothetical protein [Clostridia bacterium]
MTQISKTHFREKIMEHPVLFFTALFSLITGLVCGISICFSLYRGAVFTKTALLIEYGVNYNVFAGLARAFAIYTLFYLLVSLVSINGLFMPVSLITFLFYGFLSGLTLASLIYEFNLWGILYSVLLFVPNIMVATAMLLCFMRLKKAEKYKKLTAKSNKNEKVTSFGREIMLLFIAIGTEGLVIPLTLRLLLY